jgi:hypothetical protein
MDTQKTYKMKKESLKEKDPLKIHQQQNQRMQRFDSVNDNSRNDFLCKSLSNLHRKMDAYEKKEKATGWAEDRKSTLQPIFNAPPVPPFTNYIPVQSNPHPIFTMVQPSGPTTTPSFQPVGTMPAPSPTPMFTTNTPLWAAQQPQWSGPGRQVPGMAQGQHPHPHHQEGLQVPYQGGPAYSQYYQ